MAQYVVHPMIEYHRAKIRVFREVIDLQQEITKQIVKDIDPINIKMLDSRDTNTIQTDLPKVLAYMFTIYVTIEPEVLRERELKVCEIVYDIMNPLVTIYNKIEELGHLSHAERNPYSMLQLVNYGLTIIKHTNNFETGICI